MKTICLNEVKSEPDLIKKLSSIYQDLMKMMIEEKDYENFLNFFNTSKILCIDKGSYKDFFKNNMNRFWKDLEFWKTILFRMLNLYTDCLESEFKTCSESKKDSQFSEVISGCKLAIDFGIKKEDIIQIIEDKKDQFLISDLTLLKLILFINDYYKEN